MRRFLSLKPEMSTKIQRAEKFNSEMQTEEISFYIHLSEQLFLLCAKDTTDSAYCILDNWVEQLITEGREVKLHKSIKSFELIQSVLP